MILVGFQIVDVETDNPPAGMATYEVYDLGDCLVWLSHHDRSQYRLLPVFKGDIEEPKRMQIGGPDPNRLRNYNMVP